MGQDHHRHRLGRGAAGLLDHRLDADALLAQRAGNVGQHARPVQGGEAQVGARVQVTQRHLGPLPQVLRRVGQRRHAPRGAPAQLAGDLHQVGHHGAGGGHLARAGAVEERRPDGVAVHGDGVHGAVHVGQQAGRRDQRGVDARLDAPIVVGLGDAQQLDLAAEALGGLEVQGREPADALGGDVLEGEPRPEGHGHQQGQLVGGVDPVHVEAGVGLGVAQVLGALEHHLERLPGCLHLGEHVVGGAVHDAVQAGDLVGREPLAQGAQDGNPAAHAGLEGHVHAALAGGVEDLGAVQRQQRLVGRDHVLAALDGRQGDPAGHVVAADQLHDDLHLGVVQQPFAVRVEAHAREIHAPVRLQVQVGDAHQSQREAQALRDHLGVLLQHLHHPGADGAQADQTDADGVLAHHTFASRRKRRMPRTAWRIRCGFSTRAKRT